MALYRVMCVVTLLTLLTPESHSQLDVCGQALLNTRIVEGDNAPLGSWPWQVSLQRFGRHICGGSLINNQWVLTSTGCLISGTNSLVVHLGRGSLDKPNPNAVSRTINHVINYPHFNPATYDNDISLLRLSSPVNFTSHIRPVCLAAADSTFYNGTNAWVTGYGDKAQGVPLPSPRNLTEVEVEIVGNKQCSCSYGAGRITNNMLCTGSGPCRGDGGSPLVTKQNIRWIQAGIVSFGRGCTGFPIGYTRVSQYQSWINSHITSNQPGFIMFNSTGVNGDLLFTCPTRGPPPKPPPTLPPTPSAEICGQTPLNTRIVGGQETPAGRWPWQFALFRFFSFICGGSLISNQWVMTAAHCVRSNNTIGLYGYLGSQNLSVLTVNEVFRRIQQIIIHPNYVIRTGENDIALLKLSAPVNFSDYIRPVCLAASNSTFYNGTDTWVTGWGYIGKGVSPSLPFNLMEVEVPIVGNRQCNCDYGVGSIKANMICAGLRSGGKDSCLGDEGGPLVSKQGRRWIQAGVVSSGSECGRPNFPGVYTRVSQYESWINSHIDDDQPGFVTFTSTGTDTDLSVTCAGLPTVPTTLPPTTTTLPKTTSKPVVCGQALLNSRIVGGSTVTTAGMWPWMANLQKNGSHVCGGTLVAVDFVLSDASCFSSSPTASEWTVVLGRLKQNGSNPFEVTLNVTNITLSNSTGTNVAVLHLKTPPTLSNYIQPICVSEGRTFSVGSTCWAAGWSSGQGGEEQLLQEVQTSVVDCGNRSTTDSICTGAFTLQQGGYGGPLMCKQDGSWFQAAVLSAQNNSTTRAGANRMVFTKLKMFKSFLMKTVGPFLVPFTTNGTTAPSPGANTGGGAGGAANHSSSSFFFFFHLLILSLSLHLFI